MEKTLETVKEFTTVLILKLDKPIEMAISYKPLCLLNFLSKLLEILSKNRLINELKIEKSTIQTVEKALKPRREFTTVLIFKLEKPTEIASSNRALSIL